MNYDRFLTRVFDKQEKKMLLPYHSISLEFSEDIRDCAGTFIDDAEYIYFLGVNADGILISYNNWENKDVVVNVPFADRFVPMTCTGIKGTDNKLLYQDDIIISDNRKALIVCDDLGNNDLTFQVFNTDDLGYFHSLSFDECVAIGNRWENSKLMEKTNESCEF